MNEANKSKLILIGLSKVASLRLFRNNTGLGWIGRVLSARNGDVTLENARPLHAGLCPGSSDYIGWNSIEVTQEMVGKKVAVFTAIEFKLEAGRASKQQLNFIEQIRKSGGIAGIAKSGEDIINLIEHFGHGRNSGL